MQLDICFVIVIIAVLMISGIGMGRFQGTIMVISDSMPVTMIVMMVILYGGISFLLLGASVIQFTCP